MNKGIGFELNDRAMVNIQLLQGKYYMIDWVYDHWK